jgi:single stranded DNA-binding protein
MNHVIITGRLTDDPRFTEGTDASKNRIWAKVACEDHYSKPDENGKKHVDYIAIVAWGTRADLFRNYCKKGKQITVYGRLRATSKERADQPGKYDNYTEVVVSEVEFGPDAKSHGQQVSPDTADVEKLRSFLASESGVKALQDILASQKTAPPAPQPRRESDPFATASM